MATTAPASVQPSGKASGTILVVEDEDDLNDMLSLRLTKDGHRVESVSTGEDAMTYLKTNTPDLILLDLMLPGMDGLEVCRVVRQTEKTAATPVIMLTARGEEEDIVRGLELGADDYITKPFSHRVLQARIHAVMRRLGNDDEVAAEQDPNRLSFGPVLVQLDRHDVRVNGEPVELTATEFKLLVLLLNRPGRVYTRQQIITEIHDGLAAVTDRSVDVQIVSLRRKLLDAGDLIQTVRGVGYRFRD